MPLPFFASLGLALVGGAAKASSTQPQSDYQRSAKTYEPVTGGMSSLPARQQPNVYDSAIEGKFGYTPSSVQTQPGAGPNVAQVVPAGQPPAGQPIPGNPNIPRVPAAGKTMWQMAWEAQQTEARNTEYEYAKQNPLYGMFYGLGMGVGQRTR